MNEVRKRVLEGRKSYVNFSKHKDLAVFTVGGDYFNYDLETDTALETDFYEIIVVVEKDWLFDLMRKQDIENPLDYLQNEYTWDDSIEWFESAKEEDMIVAVEFN
jgi:hypothetical protein